MDAALIITGLIAATLIIWWISVYNKEIQLRNLTEAQKKVCEANFDKMWKVIKQITNVSDKYRDTFMEVYPQLIAGRYQNGVSKFVMESNPGFDIGLMSQLANAVETNREMFFENQKKLVAYRNEHKNLIENIPGCIFLAGKQPIEITVITSDHTEDIYKSGKENL